MVFNNLDNIKADRSVIPEGCLSFSEQALYIAEATENEFNKLFESVGINELAVFESTGTELVYEGTALEDFKTNAIKFFTDLWSKIKAAYENILDKFETAVKGTKKNLNSISKSQLDNLDPDKTFGKIHHINHGGSTPRENADKLINKIKAEFESGKDSEDKQNIKEKYQDDIVSLISGTDKTSIKEAKEALKKRYIGEEFEVDLDYVKKNFEDIKRRTFNTPRQDIKKSYNDEKGIIDDVIKYIKGFKKDDVNYAKTTISLLRDVCTTLHQCMCVEMDALILERSENRNLFAKVFIALQKTEKSENKVLHNSAVIESTQQDLVNKSFDW